MKNIDTKKSRIDFDKEDTSSTCEAISMPNEFLHLTDWVDHICSTSEIDQIWT